MPKIGLTGGIGTGKSTVLNIIKDKGYFILDADEISHGLTQKGSPLLKDIANVFGEEFIDSEGNLKRKELGRLVFSDPEKKKALEKMVTMPVADIMAKEAEAYMKSHPGETIFLDIPLLFECNVENICDKIWVVNCDEEIRIDRVMARDSMARDDVVARIRNQVPAKVKIQKADVVIDNSLTEEILFKQVERLLKEYA